MLSLVLQWGHSSFCPASSSSAASCLPLRLALKLNIEQPEAAPGTHCIGGAVGGAVGCLATVPGKNNDYQTQMRPLPWKLTSAMNRKLMPEPTIACRPCLASSPPSRCQHASCHIPLQHPDIPRELAPPPSEARLAETPCRCAFAPVEQEVWALLL